MLQPLRVVIAEDNANDGELLLRALRRAGFEPDWIRVDNEQDYLAALDPQIDIILSDYDMPQFGAPRALEVLKQSGLTIPFIIVSGTIGEDVAVESMKNGAADYLIKDRLARLGPAIRQALEQSRLRRENERAEESMRQSEHKYRHLFESLSEAAFLIECTEYRIVDVNLRAEELLSRKRAEILGTNLTELFPQAEVELFCSSIQTTGGPSRLDEVHVKTKTGKVIPVQVSYAPIELYGRSLVLALMADISSRKQSEERLREQAEMLDLANEAIIIRDYHTRKVTFWSKGAERIYGFSAGEAIGRDIAKLLFEGSTHPDEVSEKLIKTGEWHGESRVLSKGGKYLTMSTRATLVRDPAGLPKAVLSINADITDQKQLEAQFLRAQRMESIGTLASGLAHDLNNILAPIMMSVPMLRRELSPAQREGIVETIAMSASRGADIVRQVLTFGRGVEGQRVPISLPTLIREIIKIMSETFPKDIRVECQLAENLWAVVGDPTQLHQVLLNLCVNARDAMPSGGRLKVETSNLNVDESYVSMLPEAKPGPYVLLQVSDNGTGIPPAILDRIFDPFFTTKGIGKGTGLGLSTVLGIVKSHEGVVNVVSEAGRGTTFKIYLPAAYVEEEVGATPPTVIEHRGNGEVILFVDDEEPIRKAAKTVLEAHGYKVLLAGDGTEALAVFAKGSDRIAAVLTDITMPFMDGVTLIRALKRMSPNLPLVASTGLSEKGYLSELKELNMNTILAKPYASAALVGIVREALRHSPPVAGATPGPHHHEKSPNSNR